MLDDLSEDEIRAFLCPGSCIEFPKDLGRDEETLVSLVLFMRHSLIVPSLRLICPPARRSDRQEGRLAV